MKDAADKKAQLGRNLIQKKEYIRIFTAAAEQVTDSIVVTDADHRIMFANKAAEELWGYTQDELVGRTPDIYNAGRGDDEFLRTIRETVTSGKSFFGSTLSKRKDGSTFICEVKVTPILDEKGRIASYISVQRDISDRTQMEAALRESEELYRTLFEGSLNPITIYDRDGNIILLNKIGAKNLNRPIEDIIGKPLRDFIPETHEIAVKRVRHILKTRKPLFVEDQVSLPEGKRWFFSSIHPILKKESPSGLVQVVSYDITERKQAEEALQAEKDRMQQYLDIAGVIFLVIDTEQKVTLINRLGCQVLGYEEKDIVGKNWFDNFIPERLRDEVSRVSRKLFAGKIKAAEYHENPILTRSGEERIIAWHNTLLKDDAGNIIGHLSSGEDITERKQAIQALEDSEQNYRKLFESMEQGVVYQNTGGEIISANPAAERILGLSLDQMLGRTSTDPRWRAVHEDGSHFPGESHPAMVALRTGKPVRNVVMGVYHPVEDRYHWINIDAVPQFKEDERKPFQVFTTFIDITERRQAEEAAKYREELEKLISNVSAELVNMDSRELDAGINMALKAVGEFCDADRSYVFQFSGDKKTETATHEWCAPGIEPRIHHLQNLPVNRNRTARGILSTHEVFNVRRVAELSPEYKVEKKRLLANNIQSILHVPMISRRDVIGFIRLDAVGRERAWSPDVIFLLTAIGEMIGNMLEGRRAEQELEESRARYQTLFDSINDAVFVHYPNPDWTPAKFIEVNEAACKMLGYTREEILQLTNMDIIRYTGKDRPAYMEIMDLVFEYGYAIWERIFVTKDGRELPVEISAHLCELGMKPTMITIARDISQRKEEEKSRREMEQKALLASHLASVGEMASGIAHEINNPLTGVIGYSQLLLQSEDIPDDLRGDLEAINDGATRVADIVRRLLTFARQQKARRDYIDINNVIETTLALCSYELDISNIEVVTQLADDLPVTVADGGQIQQVFLNLIVNSETEMRLAHGGGKLVIKTELADSNIRISFKDNGPGIARENLDRIFDPFFTTREVGQGTGLGLSVCHGIVTDHGGSIVVKSGKGKGATFIVELPLVFQPEQMELAETVEESDLKPKTARILVVDDEPVVITFLSKLLDEEGHQVETAQSAEDALQKIKESRYNLIILDIKMPGMSGNELYKQLQGISQSLADRVLFITGDVMGDETMAFLKKTRAPYITKPFNPDQLKEALKKMLSPRR